jgi:predicted deacylase
MSQSGTGRSITRVPVFTLANGHSVHLYVHEVVGTVPGPTLGLVAAVHGDEPLSIEIVSRTLDGIDSGNLRGSVLALSVANPYAVQAATRNTPLDMTNLNRVFPGDAGGLLTEQLAHAISAEFLPRCQYLIDLHSGGSLATVDYMYLYEGDIDLSKSYGCEYLYRSPLYPGSLTDHAVSLGIPALVSELGGGAQRNEHYIRKGVRGIRNVMKHLGMISGTPEVPERQWIFTELVTLRPHCGGFLASRVTADQLGTRVAKGTVLAEIVSPYTFETLESVEAPFESTILILVRDSVTRVDPGDYGFMVANGATAKEL